MSLVPTWVLCDDRRMYRDAVLAAAADGDWFICFDDNDPPELVMQGGKRTFEEALALLKARGIHGRVQRKARMSYRATVAALCAEDRHGGDMVPSTAFFLSISLPPPAALVIHYDGEPVRNKKLRLDALGQCCVETCGGNLSLRKERR